MEIPSVATWSTVETLRSRKVSVLKEKTVLKKENKTKWNLKIQTKLNRAT